MSVQGLPITTLIVCGLGAGGVALLLIQRKPAPRRTGTAIAIIALAVLLSLFPLTSGDSLIAISSSFISTLSFLVPAGCGLVATIAVITSRSRRRGLAWFVVAVLANTVLLFVGGTVIVGVMNLIVNVGFLGTLLLFAAVSETNDESPPESSWGITGLACAVSALLFTGLLSALPPAVSTEPPRATAIADSSSRFGWSDLGRSLLFDHGISLTVVSLLLMIAMVTVSRMMTGGPSEPTAQPAEGTAA
ncbi:NADH-ubiquinone/plastoquinone oxidoreductase chain 6 [Symmachiella macrocystis]|uniref:NADH-quinone oxidoreductase subunit J n=1 Tax=Symmachiella macrocystis TaxID=2527985 RepID=A0A5C6BLT9_9PLAN|nr:NADH-quinone oxidoreductase subunit J [Symmachiella macrocystis]TWU12421.1 NADH-ubiquinone/plastoquinone oxidoreductase chain 6 [Symmachiella macrocystis]